ncbi:MAG: four helix bundle protein [Terriglobales bacterium]
MLIKLLRCATSAGANYRAACLARSNADFVSKIGSVLEKADESVFWLELLIEAEIIKRERLTHLLEEAKQLTSIFAASRFTATGKREIRTS